MSLFLLFLPLVHALSIHHRLFHPAGPPLGYIPRAQVSLDSAVPYSALPSDLHLSSQLNQLRESNLDLDKAYYQIALQRDGDVSDAQWDVSSVKYCHLNHATSDTVVLHSKESRVYALDYFVSPVPHDGSCPRRGKNKSLDSGFSLDEFNTTIVVETHRAPPLPVLRTPPALTTEGEPVKPIPEKSFIQKYWFYIVPTLLALLVSGGPEGDQPQRNAQQ